MQLDSLCEEFSLSTNTSLNFLDDITYICIAHLRYGDDRRKWCAFLCNFGAQNRPKKMLYIDSQTVKRCASRNKL